MKGLGNNSRRARKRIGGFVDGKVAGFREGVDRKKQRVAQWFGERGRNIGRAVDRIPVPVFQRYGNMRAQRDAKLTNAKPSTSPLSLSSVGSSSQINTRLGAQPSVGSSSRQVQPTPTANSVGSPLSLNNGTTASNQIARKASLLNGKFNAETLNAKNPNSMKMKMNGLTNLGP
jgi:hypothetical protein